MNSVLSKATAHPETNLDEQREILHELLLLQSELQTLLSQKVDFLIHLYSRAIASVENISVDEAIQREFRTITLTCCLSTDTAIFKGKKPLAVLLPGRKVSVKTWKEVALCILRACDEAHPCGLDALCGKVYGNHRPLLRNSADGLAAPLQIRDGLYFEGKLDTEFLLKVIVKRILIPLGYPYRTIGVRYTVR